MQKTIRLFICAILVIAAFGFYPTSSASAEAYSSYESSLTIYNYSAATDVTIDYYYGGTGTTAGTKATGQTVSIGANSVRDYAAIPINNFSGSVVISSAQPVAVMSVLTGGGISRGAYVGTSTGSKTILLPYLNKNHGSGKWSTFFAVQNIGSTATTVSVDYPNCGAAVDDKKVVKPNSSVIFDQKTTACLPNGVTSAILTSSTENIIAMVDQESTITKTSLVSSGFAAGSVTPIIPLVNSNNPTSSDWRTVITLMNLGTKDTKVKLTYVRENGTKCFETQTIKAKKSNAFAGATLQIGPAAGVTTTCPAGAKLVGSAFVATVADNSTQQPLVAVVNEDRVQSGANMAGAYGGFNPLSATPRVVMPSIMDTFGAGKWESSFYVMNVGTKTTYVQCTFAGSTYKIQKSLAAMASFVDLQGGKLGAGKTSATDCKAYKSASYTAGNVDPTAKLVGVVNIRAKTGQGDYLYTYEGVNALLP